MNILTDAQLQSLLLNNDLVTEKQMAEILEQAQQEKRGVAEVVVEKDILTEENLMNLIADAVKLPFVSLQNVSIPPEILKILPEDFARTHSIIVYDKTDKGIKIAVTDLNIKEVLPFISQKANAKVAVALTTKNDIERALLLYKSELQSVYQDIMDKLNEGKKNGNLAEVPTTKIVDTLIQYAYESKASDIHIEPEDKISLIRFRIDGVLHDVLQVPIEFHDQIVTRIKVLAKLRTDEHFSAQDGKLQVKEDDEELDIRVSIVPIVAGEKVVMRLLSSHSQRFSLSDLGMNESDLTKVKTALNKPYGMILSTGPTGSGKTTTIYALLKIINTREKNIASIEDPVEYEVPGINQIQVNPKTNLTFADGLRALLRQDPDVIFVGEIRDKETADIATNSAMTGHIVLSTLHTNDAVTALPRLLDMDIEPFLVASTVNIVIAQRLVRQICQKCRYSISMDRTKLQESVDNETISQIWGDAAEMILYKGKGCSVCRGTGYVGRIGIFEILEMDNALKEMITAKVDAVALLKEARSKGMHTMFEDGLTKVQSGLTTLDEVLRVSKVNENLT